MQALLFFPQLKNTFRNSLRGRNFFALAIPNVLLGHHDSGMPKLILVLHDIAT